MTFPATAILVLVASPGDTADERAAIQLALSRWNVDRGEREGAVVIPWLYEQHAIPVLGGYAQSIINRQAVERADVVVAFFDARLGTETPEAVSGTAEEITRAHHANKPVHVYFSREPVDRHLVDPQQLQALAEFKTTLNAEGLLGAYDDPQNLANQVVSAIDYDVSAKQWRVMGRGLDTQGAVLRARHVHEKELERTDPKGRTRYRTTSNQLVIRNEGDRTAEKVGVEAEPLAGASMHFEQPETTFDLTPGSEMGFLMIGNGGGNVNVRLEWEDEGEKRTFMQTVRLT